MPDETGETVGTILVCFLFLHARLRAHRAPGISCALLNFRCALCLAKLARHARRDRGGVGVIQTRRHCAPCNRIGGLHPSHLWGGGREAPGGGFVSRWINPTRLAFGQPPSPPLRVGRDKKERALLVSAPQVGGTRK